MLARVLGEPHAYAVADVGRANGMMVDLQGTHGLGNVGGVTVNVDLVSDVEFSAVSSIAATLRWLNQWETTPILRSWVVITFLLWARGSRAGEPRRRP